MRVRLVVALLVAGLVAAPATVADAGDLEDMLEEADTAEFHGSGVVLCMWDGESAAATYDVTRSDGMSMVSGQGGELMMSEGLMASRRGVDWYGLEVTEWSAWSLSDRYSLSDPSPTTRLGRPATSVTVFEDDAPRARLVLDDESTVPLLTEIYYGDGRTYRLAALLDFSPGTPADMPDAPEDVMAMDAMSPTADSGALPGDAAGYRRVDTYEGPGGSLQGFYTDGLFSFSVFETGRGATPDAFDDASTFEVDGVTYRRIITASHLWVQWDAPDRSYVLVGDLPPDHLRQVLAELPEPGSRGVLVRLWRRLFG